MTILSIYGMLIYGIRAIIAHEPRRVRDEQNRNIEC